MKRDTIAVNEEGRRYVEAARGLADGLLSANAQRVDRDAAFPAEGLRAMADLGLCGMTIPKEFGGAALDAMTICSVTEELARGCPSTAGVLMAYVIGIQPLVWFGTPAQKQTYLPGLAKAETSVCLALTEAHTGSDVSTIRTTARRDGDDWVLNGTKCLIGNAVGADLCIIAAKTNESAGHGGISMFLVDADLPGVSVGHVYEKMGMRGTTTAEIVLKDVRVAGGALIGKEGEGSKCAFRTLDLARLTLAAEATGIAQAALDEAVAYSRTRETFGKPIGEHQAIQFMIADMATSVHASRVMLHDACRRYDAGEPFNKQASMVKLFASEAACRVANKALQIHGGWGVVDRSKVERLFRDARYTEIWEGTSEIQRVIISRCVFKEATSAA